MFKKGFTLIELLAVIVVLAVIALIATPIVMNSISEARLESTRNSVYGILKSAEQAYAESILEDVPLERNTNIIDQIDFKGQEPDSGQVIITNEGYARAALIFGDRCFLKIHDEVEIIEDLSECVVTEFVCGDTIFDERDNNTYQTVQIGEQCWFSEDSRYTSEECLNSDWATESPFSACRTHFAMDENEHPGIEEHRQWEQLNVLYQWDAAQDACPSGFRVASDDDFKELELFAGLDFSEVDLDGLRESGDVGLKLSSDEYWNGTNDLGFNALPAGLRTIDGSLRRVGNHGGWWTSTESGEFVYRRYIWHEDSGIYKSLVQKIEGRSVRCIR